MKNTLTCTALAGAIALCGVLTSLAVTAEAAGSTTPVAGQADEKPTFGQGNAVAFFSDGPWEVFFYPQDSAIRCNYGNGCIEVVGRLSFCSEKEREGSEWKVVESRDGIPRRLAIIDKRDNVQAYVVFYREGNALVMRAAHRPPHHYSGTLRFSGQVCLENKATGTSEGPFACRTRPTQRPVSVVQMATGMADSRLNDSIFDPKADRVFRLSGNSVRLGTIPAGTSGNIPAGCFAMELSAQIDEPSAAEIRLEPVEHYYHDRFVPRYRPIDKQRCASPPTGWMSWNTYFDKATEEDNLAEARIGAEKLKPFGMEIWHIESWQDNSDKLPVSRFHCLTLRPNPRQFPHGMKWLADEIRKLGFKPGIWTVPFGTGDEQFYRAHKDWFLHNPDGSPMRNWCGLYLLDPSQDEVVQHMEETHRKMSEQWGYEYFKIDGMSGRSHGYSAHFFERPEVQAAFRQPCKEPFRRCLEALRRGIGNDAIWLACQGHYSGNEIGLADAGRLGADIVHANQPPHWQNYYGQAEVTLNQLFVNNIVWYTDPDTLLVGTYSPLDTARLATTVVALPGQMMFSGDKLAELPDNRMRLLQQALPVCDVRPLDLFPIFDMAPIWDLKVQRAFPSGEATWDVVGLFNWTDMAAEETVRFEDLGLKSMEGDSESWLVYDFWNAKLLGRFENAFTQTIPAHGSGLYAIHRDTGHPQFLSTDRHVTQGATSLLDLRWNDGTLTFSGKTRLVAKHATTLSFHVPPGYRLTGQEASGAKLSVLPGETQDGLLRIRLESGQASDVSWTLRFAQ